MNKFLINGFSISFCLLITIVGLSFGFPERLFIGNPIPLEKDTISNHHINDENLKLTQSGQSSICRTPSIICQLPQPGPIGNPCWCIGSSGPIQGVIVGN